MINVTENWLMPINIGVLLLFAGLMFAGYRKGLIRSLLGMAGTIIAFYAAATFSSVLAPRVQIIPASMNPASGTLLEDTFASMFSRIGWFLILFIGLKIALWVLDHMLKEVKKMPVISQVSGAAGAVLGAALAVVWVLVACVLLATPVFSGGKEAVDHTLLGEVRDTTAGVFGGLSDVNAESDALSTLQNSYQENTALSQQMLADWLDSHGYTRDGEVKEQ